jgi:ParB family chromosome partitioning protein
MNEASSKFVEPTKYDSVFWVEVDRIQPNPFQPRREFDEMRLRSLAESIRQYGVLQPLVVTRMDVEKADGGLASAYELIAGERRLRASKLIGLREVPVVIRVGEQTDHMKLELAIVENLQREDLNAIDRAKSLAQLAQEFGLTHVEIGAKVGRSREYVSNSIRLLALPEMIQNAVVGKELSEGHARALLMLQDRPEERDTLFKDIVLRKTSVRVAEQLARRIATDKVRKHDKTPEIMQFERDLTESLGTRVIIEKRQQGGRVLIEFFSPEDLTHIVELIAAEHEAQAKERALSVLDSVEAEMPDSEKTEIESSVVLIPNTTLLTEIETDQMLVANSSEVNYTMLTEDEIDIPQGNSERFVPEPQHITTEDSYEAINFTV